MPARAVASGRRGSFCPSKMTSPLRRTVPDTARSVVVEGPSDELRENESVRRSYLGY